MPLQLVARTSLALSYTLGTAAVRVQSTANKHHRFRLRLARLANSDASFAEHMRLVLVVKLAQFIDTNVSRDAVGAGLGSRD